MTTLKSGSLYLDFRLFKLGVFEIFFSTLALKGLNVTFGSPIPPCATRFYQSSLSIVPKPANARVA